MVAAQLNDPQSTLSDTLRATAHAIEESHISLRQMLALVGEQGMLLFCVLLTVPFLLPVSIPGVSTPFGLLILFIGIGITLNRVPWLPAFLMERRFASINDLPIGEADRRFHWPLGRRPDDHPGLSDLQL